MNSGRGKLFFFLNEYFQDEFTEHTTYIYVRSEKLYIEVLDFTGCPRSKFTKRNWNI